MDARPIRFVSIPKCASRSLQRAGLLGVHAGRAHACLTEYPSWETYDWHVVTRDKASWELSWWRACQLRPDAFTIALGFRYEEMEADMKRLASKDVIANMERFPGSRGLNEWVPEFFKDSYGTYLAKGLDFQTYCQNFLTGGVPCTPVAIEDLNAFMAERGIVFTHSNAYREL